MEIYGPNELVVDVHQNHLCVNCGACVNLCPYIKSYKGKTSMLFPCTSDTGRCHANCPKTEVNLDALSQEWHGQPYTVAPLGSLRKLLMARAGSALTGGQYQDGGTVTALMTYALKSDCIDSAVLTGREGMIPAPAVVTEAESVADYAASKYMAAPTLAALNQGIEKGYRRMGIVGTPCQLTAVAQMRTNPTQKSDFVDPVALTVGLFCTWALDTRDMLAYLKERMPLESITKMTIPPPPAGVLVVETGQDSVSIPLEEIRQFIPEGCHICADMTAEWSDLSVGAMEGDSQWNTLIVRTENGEKLVQEAVDKGYLMVREMPAENQTHLKIAAAGKKKRALIKAREDGRLNTTTDGQRAALRLNPTTVKTIISD